MGAETKPTSTRSRIRRIAILLTLYAWLIGVVRMTFFDGQPLPRAAAVAAMLSLGGLVVWAIYHVLSRRNDGSAFFIMAFSANVTRGHRGVLPLKEELTKVAFVIRGPGLDIGRFRADAPRASRGRKIFVQLSALGCRGRFAGRG